MQPRITVITLGVADLERAVAFYRDGLCLPTKGIVGREIENGSVAFFDLQDRLKLAVWPRKSIAADTGLPISQTGGVHEFTLGHNLSSKEQVDQVFREATAAGARAVKPPADTSWGGYAGYFQDPDDHLWEVVFNPELLP